MSYDLSSRSRLAPAAKAHFQSESLFDRIARVVCDAHCLPRKELFESWEVARRTRRRFRGGRIVDLAAGHGLIAHMMLLLDDSSPNAVAVDTRLPQSAPLLHQALTEAWPRLRGRIELLNSPIADLPLGPGDLVVSAHACGLLTDEVIAGAVAARARVSVLPCCQDVDLCNTGGVDGWMDGPLAIDVTRVANLRAARYKVWAQSIPKEITEKNRLILAEPT